MDALEIEVKFLLSDIAALRNRLIAANAKTQGRHFETNTRYDDSAGSLMKKHALLRLRQDKRSTLTVKSPPNQQDTEFKVHNELEIEVSSFDTTDAMLRTLGFQPAQVYEKWRETFTAGTTVFCIDELPFGTFLEIEGDRPQIKTWSETLSLNWEDRILTNYLALFETLKKKLRLPFNDVSFDNFRSVDLTEADLPQLIRETQR